MPDKNTTAPKMKKIFRVNGLGDGKFIFKNKMDRVRLRIERLRNLCTNPCLASITSARPV